MATRVLVGGVGYRNLRDHSLGVMVSDRLAERDWADGILIEDASYNPVAFVQRLEDDPPGRLVFVSAVSRGGRALGSITAYRWDANLPGAERVQAAVAEAVTGVIALDNTLIVARQFGALSREVTVVEVEPEEESFGEILSPAVAAVFDDVCTLVATLATDPAAAHRLPEAPLGGGALPRIDVS